MRSASSSLAEGTINTILKHKILITGACGWLGINLIKTYLDGIDIYDETKNLSSKYDVKVFILPHEYIKLFSIFVSDPEKLLQVAFSSINFLTVSFVRQVKFPNFINFPVNVKVIILCKK